MVWEYQHNKYNNVHELNDAELDARGKSGWELVTVILSSQGTVHAYFKRPKQYTTQVGPG